MKQLRNKQSGFTLIEVVLVLAIGALIILMALLAFNGAQRARKDTARTNLVGTISASVEQYAANNNGTYPDAAGFAVLVSGSKWTDPAGGPVTASAPSTSVGIYYEANQVCSGSTAPASGSYYRITYVQGNGQTACKDSTK